MLDEFNLFISDEIIEILIHYKNQKGEDDTRIWSNKNFDKVARQWPSVNKNELFALFDIL